ncbi:hypothetical protein DYH09_15470 [bacterium CPR1]|nr:hypothetical protein [bacterium CPR1]
MSDKRDRQLEKLYAQQEKHAEKVKSSVQDMKKAYGSKDRGGALEAHNIKKIAIGIVALLFLIMSAVMLSDPASRKAWFFVVFCAVGGGVFVYSKRQAGG